MNIEYEATFTAIDKRQMRLRLRRIKAALIHPEFLQKRVVFKLPKGHDIKGGWLRVRQEYSRVTMSLKIVNGKKINDQREVCLTIDDFNAGIQLLKTIGCVQKSYQENKREHWRLNGVDVTIDTWPFLETFVEIEGPSASAVKKACGNLNLDYRQAKFCATDTLYMEQYGMSRHAINFAPKIVFNMKNPFLKK